jgi:hypothetical protein
MLEPIMRLARAFDNIYAIALFWTALAFLASSAACS